MSEAAATVRETMDTGVAEVRRRGRSDAVEDLFSSSDADRSSGRMLRLARETWPSQERFPVNHASASVGRLVSRDLVSSSQPLVVTGFASIGELIDLIGDWAAEEHVARMRVVLGSEPFRSHRLAFGSPTAQFTDEVRRYWLETEGISLRLSAKILQVK